MSNNFFDSIKKSFVDIHVDKEKNDAIETTGFLEASESLVTFFGRSIPIAIHMTLAHELRFTRICSF